MFGDGSLTFREFVTGERVPLATLQEAVLELLEGRNDAAVFGAQAVNAYANEPRMTQDVDILSPRAEQFATELRAYLAERFQIAVRVKKVSGTFCAQHPPGRSGKRFLTPFSLQCVGYRLYQVRKPQNRHLVDVWRVEQLPPCNRLQKVLVAAPAELISHKVRSMAGRRNAPKGMTDAADLRRLLLAFPELKTAEGLVADALQRGGAPDEALYAWRDLVAQEIEPDDDETGF